jgi:ribosomal-protein-alanine N-acetyltransferase
MTSSLTIRQAGFADIYQLWLIEKSSFSSPWSFWCFFSELANPISAFLLAGPAPPQPWEIQGYIVYWVAAQEMHILNLAVHPGHRRLGVGKFLLTEALARARAAGAELAWLEVRPSNTAALSLYDSFGFTQTGRRRKYYEDNQEDALLLTFAWEENS